MNEAFAKEISSFGSAKRRLLIQVRPPSTMRILAVIVLMLASVKCFASQPEYFSSREWIEQHTPKNQTPQDKRIFVGDSIETTNTYILRYHAGISLRDVIDFTAYKGLDAFVIILRRESKKPVFFDIVKQGEKQKFELRVEDVIWISTDRIKIN